MYTQFVYTVYGSYSLCGFQTHAHLKTLSTELRITAQRIKKTKFEMKYKYNAFGQTKNY